MASVPNAFQGMWHITKMEMWNENAMNMEVRAFIEFMDDRKGRFQFCLVQGFTDCRFETRDGLPFVEFSWNGFSEHDPMSGRGWARLDGHGLMSGRIFIHDADESGFSAVKV